MPNPQPIGTPTARNPYQTRCLTSPSSAGTSLDAHSGIVTKPTTSIQTAMVSCSAIPIILAVKHSFSPNPFPSSSDLPIWMHLMLRLARSIWMLEKYAKKKERQKIERKKWKKPWKEDVGSTASLHNENVQETHSQSFFFFFSVLKHSIHTNIFRQTHWIGIHQIGPQHMNNTNQWKCWWHLSVKILNVCSKINILT